MNNHPDPLNEVLHRWQVVPPANPNFRHRVWQRIGRRGRASWPAYLRRHATAWSLAAIVVLGAAAYTGRAAAAAQTRADREALVVNYLVDLDPRAQAVLKAGAP